ncbi:hypothetical protein IT398_01455 [Candidatus Nomurabacteria bacterium]|nr:hypothetical protein [Candidatus Nomurabacteria bacterium]
MKTCPTCQRTSAMGGGYSNRTRATQFNPTGATRHYPNLQWAKLPSGGRIKLCAKCIKKGKQLQLK